MIDPPSDGSEELAIPEEDEEKVTEREATSARVVHEVIRREGEEELARPTASLLWSSYAAGLAISSSVMAQSLLHAMLPDAPWRVAVSSIGYCLGFIIVILGRLQLFTESTLLGVIPVVTHFCVDNFVRILRLWALVFVANMAGTFTVALLVHLGWIGVPGHAEAMLEFSQKLLDLDASQTLAAAIPAGFLMAVIAWALPAGRGQEFWIVAFITYFIALAHFAHVVAGSTEIWLLVLAGEVGLGDALGNLLLPAFVGNVIGGTFIFALLAHAQVRQEL